ncbi:MAG TPA: PPC domain-containing DNA-binding protein [Candidatus Sulfopaludibacter sp.]|nr:PPC domain-containing DNA-binding protein [Candidatus Sulfopaludibacter sp.]
MRHFIPRLIQILSFLAILDLATARPTRTEVTNATTPAGDVKSNSDQVPDVYALTGQFDRVVVLRFKYQTDLLAGLERMVKDCKIRNAVILSGIGSVKSYHYHTVSNGAFPSKNIFVRNPDGPADIAGMNGYVIDGRFHAHISFADPDKAFGGHLEPGTTVFTFAVVTVGVFKDGMDLNRVDDQSYRWQVLMTHSRAAAV